MNYICRKREKTGGGGEKVQKSIEGEYRKKKRESFFKERVSARKYKRGKEREKEESRIKKR